MSKLFIFTDGGSRGNPGAAAIGVYVVNEKSQVVYEQGTHIGVFTNNEAEYDAFSASVEWLLSYLSDNAVDEVVWQLDSKLVVEQLQKKWKIKEERLLVKAQRCWQGLSKVTIPFSIKHVRREFNQEADRLVNQALDAHTAGM